jgi:hypothetical protein
MAEITAGPLSRKVNRGRVVAATPLSPDAVPDSSQPPWRLSARPRPCPARGRWKTCDARAVAISGQPGGLCPAHHVGEPRHLLLYRVTPDGVVTVFGL